MSESLLFPWTAAHHASPSCLSPRVCSDSCALSQWCHITISSSATPLSFCLQSYPAPELLPKSRHFGTGSQSIGASALASVLPMNIQGWFPLGWIGLISLQSKNSQESSPASQFKSISSLALSLLYDLYLTAGKTIALMIQTFVGKMCLLFNMPS